MLYYGGQKNSTTPEVYQIKIDIWPQSFFNSVILTEK